MADAVRDWTGQQLGNYRLQRLLRHESTVDVYLGEHIFLKTQAAIRVLPGQLSQGALEAFLGETRNIARMKHPNILRILEFGVEDKTPFLVTDYTPNGSLRQRHPGGTPVPSAEIASYVKQVAAALQYIHSQGMVHRGVRPENMLIGPQNRILLSDFSPVIEALDEAPTRNFSDSEEERAEELKYMAPEQLQGQPGPASDQYALGVVVYEWLSGDTPFHGSMGEIREQRSVLAPLHTKVPTIPPELDRLVRTALEQDPGKRFASVAAFAHALKQILPSPGENGQIISETLTMPLPSPAKSYTGHNVTRGIGIGLILLVLLIIGGSLLYNTGIFASSRKTTPTITHAQATQTVVARGTQQAVATFTAQSPQEIYTAATRGKPFFNDPLKDGSEHVWDSGRSAHASCGFSNGVYQAQIVSGNYFMPCLASTINAHNFAYEVQMRLVKGSTGGLVFRSNHSGTSFYNFQAQSADGDNIFNFVVYKNNEAQEIISSGSIYNMQNFNTYTVIAYDNKFYFYINKTLLVVSQDSTLTIGAIGVYASNIGARTTSAQFRDAKVWKL